MTQLTGDGLPAAALSASEAESLRSFLKGLVPYDVLSPEGLEEIVRDARELRFERGQVLFQEGQPSDSVHVLRSGRVRVQHLHRDGVVRIVCMQAPGDTFCCLPAMDGGKYPAGAVAAERSTICRLSGAAFRHLMQREAPFATRAIQDFCARLRKLGCESCWKTHDAAARLAGKILCMAQKFGDDVPLTRRELGELAGTTVETAIRTIKDFERAGWVQLGRARLRVLNRTALAERADSANPLVSPHIPIPEKE